MALSYRANLYWPYGYRTVLTNRYLYRTNLYWPYGYRTVLTNRYLYRTNWYCGPHTRYRSSLAIERHRRDAVGDTDGLSTLAYMYPTLHVPYMSRISPTASNIPF